MTESVREAFKTNKQKKSLGSKELLYLLVDCAYISFMLNIPLFLNFANKKWGWGWGQKHSVFPAQTPLHNMQPKDVRNYQNIRNVIIIYVCATIKPQS